MTVRTDKLAKNKLNQSRRTSGNLHCNYDGEIRQKWDLVITFDQGSYWRKVNASELHFAWSFQGVPTGPYLARPNLRVKYHKIWPHLPYLAYVAYFRHIFRRAEYGWVGYPWKDLENAVQTRWPCVNRTPQFWSSDQISFLPDFPIIITMSFLIFWTALTLESPFYFEIRFSFCHTQVLKKGWAYAKAYLPGCLAIARAA